MVEGIFGFKDRTENNTSSFAHVPDGKQQEDALFQNKAVI